MKTKKIIVFDLDDTLYNEIDFLKSAFYEISRKMELELCIESKIIFDDMLLLFKENANIFNEVLNKYNSTYTVDELLSIYRNHKPTLKLSQDRQEVLKTLNKNKISMGILTDGRSIQQRNKITALGLNTWFSEIVISEEFGSEKPNINNYKYFEKIFGFGQYYYVGDNISKDFVTPNKLNWTTICLKDNGFNIHKQDSLNVKKDYLAKYIVSNFLDVLEILNIEP